MPEPNCRAVMPASPVPAACSQSTVMIGCAGNEVDQAAPSGPGQAALQLPARSARASTPPPAASAPDAGFRQPTAQPHAEPTARVTRARSSISTQQAAAALDAAAALLAPRQTRSSNRHAASSQQQPGDCQPVSSSQMQHRAAVSGPSASQERALTFPAPVCSSLAGSTRRELARGPSTVPDSPQVPPLQREQCEQQQQQQLDAESAPRASAQGRQPTLGLCCPQDCPQSILHADVFSMGRTSRAPSQKWCIQCAHTCSHSNRFILTSYKKLYRLQVS